MSSGLFLISSFWISIFSSKDFVTASRTESNASSVFSSYSILFVSVELVSGISSSSSFTFLLIFPSNTPSDFSCLSLTLSFETSSDFMVSSIVPSTWSASFSLLLFSSISLKEWMLSGPSFWLMSLTISRNC